MKKLFIQIVALILFVGILPIHSNALVSHKPVTFDIVALGDSLAAGVTPENGAGPGYGDLLAIMLAEHDLLDSFNKGFAVPGYKTTDLLEDLAENIKKPAADYNFHTTYEYGEEMAIKEAIEQANVIVMSIGANDVLSNVTVNEDGSLDYELAVVRQAIQTVAQNIEQLLTEIAEINPDASVLFMGYYNPFPYNTANSIVLNMLVGMLDGAVQASVEKMDAKFIDVKDEVGKNYETFLPNPKNIHLSVDGYQYVAEKMHEQLPLYHIANPNVIVPSDVVGHWSESFVVQAIEAGIFNGYEDGTFRPENSLTRLEMTSLLKRGLHLPESDAAFDFKDLGDSHAPMVEELRAVYAAGIVKGDGSGYFHPKDSITREEMALMLLRAYELTSGAKYTSTTATTFTDIEHLAKESQTAIGLLYEMEIIDAAENFNPHNQLKRGEAAKMLVNFLNK